MKDKEPLGPRPIILSLLTLSLSHTHNTTQHNTTQHTTLYSLTEEVSEMAATHQNTRLGLLLLISLLTLALSNLESDPNPPSVWEILPKYGLPRGLLPDSVKSYSLSDDGSFVVELEKPCYVHFDYLVYYDRKITGKLQVGSISDLHGIEVMKLFFWLDVDEIKVDLPPSNSIYFQVGIINKKLNVVQFETVHSCSQNSISCAHSRKHVFEV